MEYSLSSSTSSSSSFSLQQWLSSLLLLISFIPIFLYLIRINRGSRNGRPRPPKVPGAWPLMGHLHLFGGNDPLHIVLGTMADMYGPVFAMQLGTHPALVVSSSDIAKECFTSTNDKSFSYRPIPAGIKHMFYNEYCFGFAPYGSYWREMRKIAALSLFSNYRVEMPNPNRTSQVNIWFKNLYELCTKDEKRSTTSTNQGGVLVEMKSWFDEMFFCVVVNMIVKLNNDNEKDDDHDQLVKKYREVATEATRLMSGIAVSDLVPSLGWLDHLFGMVGKMKKTAKGMDSILGVWLEQYKINSRQQLSKGADQKTTTEEGKGYIGDLLSMQDTHALSRHERDIIIKSACQVLIFGGSDSAPATLTWVIALLLNHRDVLEKARDELDRVVGKERQVDDSDIKDLVYLPAILKETMRLYPAAPLLERIAVEDCIVGGFHVQAGTKLYVNVSKVQRDSNVWLDPSEFKPDRFLTRKSDVDLKAQDYEHMPFGSGRRICPAVSFSVQVMLLILARFIHSFEIKTREVDEILDMTESAGLTNWRAGPLDVLISPRLDSKIYA